MLSIIALYNPVEGFFFVMGGYSLYPPRLLYGLVRLAMGLYARALYKGLYIVIVALLRGLVMLCACVMGLCVVFLRALWDNIAACALPHCGRFVWCRWGVLYWVL